MFYAQIGSIPEDIKEAVLLNSGGIDSRVVAKLATDRGIILHSLFVDSNPAISEVSKASVEETAKMCIDHEVFLWPVDWRITKPLGHFSMPFSGFSAQLIGAQYASYRGLKLVLVGDRKGERRLQNMQSLSDMFAHSFTQPVSFCAPLWETDFMTTIQKAKEKGVDITNTYSCVANPPCGKCLSCVNRAKVGL